MREPVDGEDVEQLVAVVEAAGGVDDLHPVAVAVEGDAVVGAARAHRVDQRLRRGRAEAGVDVEAVGTAADRRHLGAELVEDLRRDVIGGAVRAVDDDREAAQRQVVAVGALAELDVATAGVVEPARPAELGRADPALLARDRALDLALPDVGKLLAAGREELDAVVVERVVRGADDDAEVEPERPRQVGHARRRQRPGEDDVDAGRGEACLERRLDHVARDARVLADQHGRPVRPLTQHLADGVAEAQHEVGRDRRVADRAADAVGAEVGSAHGMVPLPGRRDYRAAGAAACQTASAATVAATSWTRTMLAPRSTASTAATTLAASSRAR